MKLLSRWFHFQGTWLKPSVSGSRRLSIRRFLWVPVQCSPTSPATALAIQPGDRPETKQPYSSYQRNPAPLWPRLQTEICASSAVARASRENFSYIQSNN